MDKTERIPFVVTGEHITRMARDIALGGDWPKAVDWLMASLIGASVEHCERVLLGEWSLGGDSATGVVVLEDSTSGHYVRDLLATYPDGFLHEGRRHVVDTVVDSLGPHDHVAVFGSADIMTGRNVDSRQHERALIYSSRMHKDRVVIEHEGMFVVCFPQEAPSIASTYESLNEFMLNERGSVRRNGWKRTFKSFDEMLPVYTGKYNAGILDSRDPDEHLAHQWIRAKRDSYMTKTENIIKLALEAEDPTDVVVLTVEHEGEIKDVVVQRAPLERWAFEFTGSSPAFSDRWQPISPSGLKMQNDSGAHTDWVISAGFDPATFYEDSFGQKVNDAAIAWAQEREDEEMNFNMTTLANGFSAPYDGTIVHAGIDMEYDIENPILVLPSGGVEYYNTVVFAARKNGGRCVVVLERDSRMCHLVVNANEKPGITIGYVKGAQHVLPDGAQARVDSKYGEIRLAREVEQ